MFLERPPLDRIPLDPRRAGDAPVLTAEDKAPKGTDIGRASFDYLPALDGFRAISIALVVISHADLATIVPGGLGVVVFFVISGFLITRQMIAEIDATGTLSFGAFYLRRIFRLAPALLLYLALFSSLLLAMGAPITGWHLVSGVFYFANYYHIFIGYPPHNPNPILWSLSIEEHFYLVAPFTVFMFRGRLPRLLIYMGVVLLLVPLWRFGLFQVCLADANAAFCGVPGGLRIFHGTDTMFDCIVYGCATAILLHLHGERVKRLVLSSPMPWLAVAVLLATLLIRDPLFRDTARYSLQAGTIAVTVVAVLYGRWPRFSRLLSSRPFLLVGRLSYSLYLFHFGVGTTLRMIFPGQSLLAPLNLILFLAGSFALASLSYFLVERPMVGIRKRLRVARPGRHAALARGAGEDDVGAARPAGQKH